MTEAHETSATFGSFQAPGFGPGQRVFIETWGCQMNDLDSQRMLGQLMEQGMIPTRAAEEADLILLNSCSIREKAAHKAYSRLGEYRLLKAERPSLRIGFCGCVAEQEGQKALERVRELDFVVGTGRVGELSSILERHRETGERQVAVGFPEDRPYDIDSISRDGQYKGMVTIVEGCNKRCTFCVVPTTRGPERSRPLADIVREVEHLVDYGFLEIELLGQTVNHWREPGSAASQSTSPWVGDRRDREGGPDFADLLDRVARIPGVERLRFVTSYPRDFTTRMVEQFEQHSNLSSALHLPVQSGSDAVLKRMGRGYTVETYRSLVGRLRQARPALALSTDIIVGFPGESEADFASTLELVEEIQFASIYAFKYSPRPGTAALRLRGEVDSAEADRRLQRLFALQTEIQTRLNERLVGSTLDVLVTGWSKRTGYLCGRTDCHRIVHFPSPASAAIPIPSSASRQQVSEDALLRPPSWLGRLVAVDIQRANAHSLIGTLPGAPLKSGSPSKRLVSLDVLTG